MIKVYFEVNDKAEIRKSDITGNSSNLEQLVVAIKALNEISSSFSDKILAQEFDRISIVKKGFV